MDGPAQTSGEGIYSVARKIKKEVEDVSIIENDPYINTDFFDVDILSKTANEGQTPQNEDVNPNSDMCHESLEVTNNRLNCLMANGLESKSSKIKQIVEDAISLESKQTVTRILDHVNQLSTAEKLLLYLKLPTGTSIEKDPLRVSINPLGGRFEIQQTITWIKTHLEEDPDISLPKQDVYDEYITYCNTNVMKPLSTADFGKVMKQVFPRVRPRRLGTRGNSRYCYAGMRKKMKLQPPLLPDLGDNVKASNSSNQCSDDIQSAASYLIREWAEKLLGTKFESLKDLACHLVRNMCVDSRSIAAFTLATKGEDEGSDVNKTDEKEIGKSLILPTIPPGGSQTNKHRETQLQLQRKLQERVIIKEQKRKLQDQQHTHSISRYSVDKCKSKRAKFGTTDKKSRNYISHTAATVEDTPTVNETSLSDSNKNVKVRPENGHDEINYSHVHSKACSSRETFNGLDGSSEADSSINSFSHGIKFPTQNESAVTDDRRQSTRDTSVVLKEFVERKSVSSNLKSLSELSSPLNISSPSLSNAITDGVKSAPSTPGELVHAVTSPTTSHKLPIPRLPNKTNKTGNVIIFPSNSAVVHNSPVPFPVHSPKKKYKPIQPKPKDDKQNNVELNNNVKSSENSMEKIDCDNELSISLKTKEESNSSTNFLLEYDGENSNSKTEKVPEAVMNSTNGMSIGCLEKDALSDYFHGGSNSQEQEDELVQYFQKSNASSCNGDSVRSHSIDDSTRVRSTKSKNDKLSQLRLLLERNLKSGPPSYFGTTEKGKYATVPSTPLPFSSFFNEEFNVIPNNSLESDDACNQHSLPASASLSLLSQRNQSMCNPRKKPMPLLPSMLTGNHSAGFGSRRRVSFETSVMEHCQDTSQMHAVPPSPNTRRKTFNFMPISSGPHSPVGVHVPKSTASSKPSSANASPFVSPRNTPVPRSKHNYSQTNHGPSNSILLNTNFADINNHQFNSSKQAAAAKVVRSNSVNNPAQNNQCVTNPRPRAMSTNTALLKSQFINHCTRSLSPNSVNSSLFNIPGSHFINGQQSSSYVPMSPVSVSAPGSPMFQYAQNNHGSGCNGENENIQALLKSSEYGSASANDVTITTDVTNIDTNKALTVSIPPQTISSVADPLSQEVSQFFPDDTSDQNLEALLAVLPNSSQMQYRSQSVPIHRMTSVNSFVSSSAQASPLCMGDQQRFNFNNFTPSTASSVAPTPVPSEFSEFPIDDNTSTIANEIFLTEDDGTPCDTEGLNSENLNKIFNLLDDAQEQRNREQAALILQTEVSSFGLGMHNKQPSRSYPNTPIPYKHDKQISIQSSANVNSADCANTSSFASRSYPSTPSFGFAPFVSEDDVPLCGNMSDNRTSVGNLSLTALNSRADSSASASARRNINLLIDQEAGPFSMDDEMPLESLEVFQSCDTFT